MAEKYKIPEVVNKFTTNEKMPNVPMGVQATPQKEVTQAEADALLERDKMKSLAQTVTPELGKTGFVGGMNIPTQVGDKLVNVNVDTPSFNWDKEGFLTDIKKTPTNKPTTIASGADVTEGIQPKSEKEIQGEGGLPWWAVLSGLTEAGAKGFIGDKTQTALAGYAEDQARLAEQQKAFNEKYLASMQSGGAGAGGSATSPIGGYAPIPGVTPNTATITKAADLAGAKDGFNIAIAKFQQSLQQHGKGTILPSAQNETLNSARADLISSLKSMKQLGTLDAGVERLVEKYIPATGGINTMIGSNKEQLLKIAQDMRDQQNKTISAQMGRYGFKETATPTGAESKSQGDIVSYMAKDANGNMRRYDIPAEKEKAFLASKQDAKKI